MITGHVNQDYEAIIPIRLVDLVDDIKVAIYTGFNGDICIRKDLSEKLKLDPIAIEDYELGDGKITQVEVFNGKIIWFDEERVVDLIFTRSEQSLIGTGLLTRCRLEINYPNGEVFIQRIP